MTPTISVIIPTFQRASCSAGAIASVEAETYRDFELIVIDDGSTDGTGEMLESLDTRGLRFHYRWQPNRGVAAARNVGLELARGEIIAFLDSDDLWLTDHLDVVVEVFRRQPEAVLVSTCPKYILAGRQQSADAALTDYRSAGLVEAGRVGFPSCIAVRAEAIRQAGGFDERLGAIEDSDLFRRLATLGPFATVRRRTVLAQATSGSLRRRAATSGRYLKAAELSAENLTTAVGRMPEADRRRLEDQPRQALHLARAMRALDRRDETTLRAELEIACEKTVGGMSRVRGGRPLVHGSCRDRSSAEAAHAEVRTAPRAPGDARDADTSVASAARAYVALHAGVGDRSRPAPRAPRSGSTHAAGLAVARDRTLRTRRGAEPLASGTPPVAGAALSRS